MKKLIIFSILTLSFSTISPVFASEISVSEDTVLVQESVPNVLPQSENVLSVLPVSPDSEPAIETVIESTPVSVPEVLPPSLPRRLPSGHIPTISNVTETPEEILPVTPPCPAICPDPHPVIVPIGTIKVLPCREIVVPAIEADTIIPQDDQLVDLEAPCSPITPVIQETSTGSGGGLVFFPTNVIPVNNKVKEDISTETPVQEVLGEKKVNSIESTSPSFPKTGAAPMAPSAPATSNTTPNVVTIISFYNDRKQETVIV